MVKQGELLAQVDPRPYEVALQQASASSKRDEALLKNAQMTSSATASSCSRISIARQQYDTQVALVRQYEAALVIDQGRSIAPSSTPPTRGSCAAHWQDRPAHGRQGQLRHHG